LLIHNLAKRMKEVECTGGNVRTDRPAKRFTSSKMQGSMDDKREVASSWRSKAVGRDG
jgi:hypothetical protein